jgi:hypothetical protein
MERKVMTPGLRHEMPLEMITRQEIRARLEEIMISTAPRLPDRFTKPIEDAAEARGGSKALLLVIDARGLEISDEQRDRVQACTDLALFHTWLARAATATTAEEVFGDA